MANPQEIRKKIQARKAEKVAAEKAKYAKMKRVAEEAPGSVEKSLEQLADACAAQAEAFDILRENLDLIQAPKEASLKTRIAAARQYAKEFKRVADEQPGELAAALNEAYHSLDEQAGALENLAGDLGIDLSSTPVEEAFAEEGRQELEEADESGVPVGDAGEPPFDNADEKEAAGGGGGWYTTDRDTQGQPKSTEEVTVPRIANSGPGGAGFVTDRDKDAKPQRPAKAEIPQAEGQGQTPGNKGAARKRSDDKGEPAAAFVKDIPQAEGKGQTPTNKAGRTRPLTQIVPGGTPTPMPAEAFVRDIPQSEGQGQTPGNKSSRLRRPLVAR